MRDGSTNGRLAEWLMQRTANPCTSVRFRYRPPTNTALFRLSSAVEQSAVNRLVACSNQAAGAKKRKPTFMVGFLFFVSDYLMRIGEACSIRARIKIASVKQFLTQVTLLLVCELVTTTRNKLYKGGDRSELANEMSL